MSMTMANIHCKLQSHSLKLLRDARKRSIRKGLCMDVSAKEMHGLFAKQGGKCALSGVAMLFCGDALHNPHAMSLDRINSKLGYVKNNVQLLTRAVNNAKSTMSTHQFLQMCIAVTDQHNEHLVDTDQEAAEL